MTSAYIEDPPAYIRNTSAYKELVSAYKEPIHLQAFRLEAMNSYAVNRHIHIRALGQQQELPSVCTYRSIVADRLAMLLILPLGLQPHVPRIDFIKETSLRSKLVSSGSNL